MSASGFGDKRGIVSVSKQGQTEQDKKQKKPQKTGATKEHLPPPAHVEGPNSGSPNKTLSSAARQYAKTLSPVLSQVSCDERERKEKASCVWFRGANTFSLVAVKQISWRSQPTSPQKNSFRLMAVALRTLEGDTEFGMCQSVGSTGLVFISHHPEVPPEYKCNCDNPPGADDA